ncbi:uncharacterized protein LOC120266405 isoform X4 [Dioscorea cayenensis subsp. rotundata]|uniref:Uncharacterized protein LOC120266405 isoform X4 n=1 Tax=Dioscorea cayennensis subsp. rotundata TaxID=55577 RepID=A0AB40BRK2_DIOCR|nr:uncharacterized protein LOC120266405 isoform X4 [Dioscorea cayenensis subsp. rotundata]
MAAMELARAALERTEVWQFGVVILFFHVSEYALAVAFHGLSNVTRSTCLCILGDEYVCMLCVELRLLSVKGRFVLSAVPSSYYSGQLDSQHALSSWKIPCDAFSEGMLSRSRSGHHLFPAFFFLHYVELKSVLFISFGANCM